MKLAILVTAAALLTGCASAKFDAEKTHSVRKLAVLGIEIQQQQPKDALGIKKLSEFNARIGDSPELQEMAKDVFNDLAERIRQKTGWHVAGLNALRSNETYSEKVRSAMSGLRNVTITGGGYEIVALKGMLDVAAFRNMNQEEKVRLARALGADAFAVVQIFMQIDQGWSIGNLSGDAAFSFQARSNLEVYGLASDDPIWRIQNVDGEQTGKSDGLDSSLPTRSKLARLGREAADTSIEKVIGSYK